MAKRLRATKAAAAAPNSNTIGGAGTGAGGPPLDPVLPDELLDVELLVDELLDPLLLPDEPFDPPVELQPLLVDQPWLLDPMPLELLVEDEPLLPPPPFWFWFSF